MPRRDKLWHTFVVLILGWMAWLSLGIPERVYGKFGYGIYYQWVEGGPALSAATQGVFTGSSHIYCGMNPARYSMSVVNVAMPGLDYAMAPILLKHHLKRAPNVQLVVLEWDEVPVVMDFVQYFKGDVRPFLQAGLTVQDIPTRTLQERVARVMDGIFYPVTILPRLTPYHLLSHRVYPARNLNNRNWSLQPDSRTGYLDRKIVLSNRIDVPARFARLLQGVQEENGRPTPGAAELISRNIQGFHDTVDLLRRQNIKVVLLRLPHPDLYWKRRPAALRAAFSQLKTATLSRYGNDAGVLMWDYGDRPEFTNHDFADLDHLNNFGADKLAKLLDGRLRDLLKKPDVRKQ